MGAQVTATSFPTASKRLAPSGAAVVGQEMKPDPVALGQPALSLLDVIPVIPHAQTEFGLHAPDRSDQQCGRGGRRRAPDRRRSTR